MPAVEISKADLESLLGVELSERDIYEYIPRLKCEIEELRGDTIVLEVSSDRPDLFSVEGIARALRPWLGIKQKEYMVKESNVVGFAERIPQRPFVALAVVRDVKLNETALAQVVQLQERIAETYGRKRRKVSIGVYDLDLVKPPIHYVMADPGTKYRPLGETREMTLREVLEKTEKGLLYGHIIASMEMYPVLRDSQGSILSLVPILNSEDCKVTASTRNILIDATGTSLHEVLDAITIMSFNIAERSKTRLVEVVSVHYPDGLVIKAPRTGTSSIKVAVADANNLLGLELDASTIANLLQKFDYEVVEAGSDKLVVKPPVYRVDVKTWVDVVEDIAISYGYERLGEEADHLPRASSAGRIHLIEYFSRRLRDVLTGLGFQEVANYMMSSRRVQLEMMNVSDKEMFLVENPRSERFEGLRVWLAPQLLEVIVENARKFSRIAIFEIGDVVEPDESHETRARVERHVGMAISHEKATLTDGLAYVKALLEELKVKPLFKKGVVSGLLKERTAIIEACGTEIGFVGELDPVIAYRLELKNPVVIAELNLNKIISACL